MANQVGLRTEELTELRKLRAIVDEAVGNLKRLWQLADEETDEARRMEMKRQILKGQDELMECIEQIRGKIKEAS